MLVWLFGYFRIKLHAEITEAKLQDNNYVIIKYEQKKNLTTRKLKCLVVPMHNTFWKEKKSDVKPNHNVNQAFLDKTH